ncbi:uncharacterized protein SCHCODRAFT_02526805 [Schizophyllum commune H4-8]|uniref:uncharacterized protein n=1 Tax=Schizophyllum commune (strain H4-8 / FGSC 9210) TaxID=578458 RepID=UPI00215E67C6|nr:uncharacterized protein SCHCODRAFT_02526805 [Schizophyllum commune H4-8]KAI5900572.1 hypothetical protein SCHCODRAFT_02526805 [Schizophyllum commune H4-8]
MSTCDEELFPHPCIDWYRARDLLKPDDPRIRALFSPLFSAPPWEPRQSSPPCVARAPRAVAELKMYALSAAWRERPEWWRKVKDPVIREQWLKEAKAEQENEIPRWRLTDRMINHTLIELEAYAKLRDENTGIECGPYDCIWQSDKLVTDDLRLSLRDAIKPLEDEQANCPAQSNAQALDLIDPNLYPLVYGQTYGKQPDGFLGTFDPPSLDKHDILPEFNPQRSQWIPSDFRVKEDGRVSLISPYVNGVPPAYHDALVPVLEQIVARAVPLWERVLHGVLAEMPVRLGPVVKDEGGGEGFECIWEDDLHMPKERTRGTRDDDLSRRPLRLPDCRPEYDGRLAACAGGRYNLSGRTLQTITKITNINLTPEDPIYTGEYWHFDGLWNEGIVSTFVYYHDLVNVREARISFREGTAEPAYHSKDDHLSMETLYGIEDGEPCVQGVGSIALKSGCCIAYPNFYQHKMSPLKLEDQTKPGTCKMLTLFLVDPNRRIPSGTEVPPQQADAVREALLKAGSDSLFSKLPPELIDTIVAHVDGLVSEEEAFKLRQEMVDERAARAQSAAGRDLFTHVFHMC